MKKNTGGKLVENTANRKSNIYSNRNFSRMDWRWHIHLQPDKSPGTIGNNNTITNDHNYYHNHNHNAYTNI